MKIDNPEKEGKILVLFLYILYDGKTISQMNKESIIFIYDMNLY